MPCRKWLYWHEVTFLRVQRPCSQSWERTYAAVAPAEPEAEPGSRASDPCHSRECFSSQTNYSPLVYCVEPNRALCHIPATEEQAPSMPEGEGERDLPLFGDLNIQVSSSYRGLTCSAQLPVERCDGWASTLPFHSDLYRACL